VIAEQEDQRAYHRGRNLKDSYIPREDSEDKEDLIDSQGTGDMIKAEVKEVNDE
jgi:hypothetical protein